MVRAIDLSGNKISQLAMDKKIIKTKEDLELLAAFGGVEAIEAAADFEAGPDDRVQEFTEEENIDWDDIPDSEKVSSEEMDAISAHEEGMWDGTMDITNKRITKAIESGDVERVRIVRKTLGVTDGEVEALKNA